MVYKCYNIDLGYNFLGFFKIFFIIKDNYFIKRKLRSLEDMIR